MIENYIYNNLTGNTNITNLVGSNIFFKSLPFPYDFSNPAIVFDVDRTGNDDNSTLRDMEEDSLVKIKIIGTKPDSLEPINDLVNNFFKNDLTGLTIYGCVLLFNSDLELYDDITNTTSLINVFRGKYYKK